MFNVNIKLDSLWTHLEAMSLSLSVQYQRNLSLQIHHDTEITKEFLFKTELDLQCCVSLAKKAPVKQSACSNFLFLGTFISKTGQNNALNVNIWPFTQGSIL